MPTADRQARTAQTALRFGQWLDATMTAQNIRNYELVERAAETGGTFQIGHVTHWRNGDNTAQPHHVLVLARVLRQDPVLALRKAGYDEIADAIEQHATAAPTAPTSPEPTPPERPAHPAIGAIGAMIRESGLPATEQEVLRETFDAELDDVQAIIARRIERLRREIEFGQRILDGEDNARTHNTA